MRQPGEESGHAAVLSLLQLEQSIQRTQQLLAQAQRIAYDIQQIDRAFSTTYAPATSSIPTGVDGKRAIALAERDGRLRRHATQATVVGTSIPPYPDVGPCHSSQGATGVLQASRPVISSWPCRLSNSRISLRRRGPRARAKPRVGPACVRSGPGQGATRRFLTQASAINPQPYNVSLMNAKKLKRSDRGSRVLIVLVLPLAQSGYVTTRAKPAGCVG